MKYFEYAFRGLSPELTEIMVAMLADAGFDTFDESEDLLYAYLTEDLHTPDVEQIVKDLQEQFGFSYSSQHIKDKNWNEEWEKNYSPILVRERCLIRAPFHEPLDNVDYDLIIEPRMAFGTGHHASTELMVGSMLDIDFEDKLVCDAGCGTAVLAVLAARMGAASVTGIDNNDWAYSNALDNIVLNHTEETVRIELGELEMLERRQFDVILANINRNILIEYAELLKGCLKPGGSILLSGILNEDEDLVLNTYKNTGMDLISAERLNGWSCLHVRKP